MSEKKIEGLTPEEEEADFQKLRKEEATRLAKTLTNDLLKLSNKGQVPERVILLVRTMDFKTHGSTTQWQLGSTSDLGNVEILGALEYAKLQTEIAIVDEIRHPRKVDGGE